MENASRAFLGAVQDPMQLIRRPLGAGRVDPAWLARARTSSIRRFSSSGRNKHRIRSLGEQGIPTKEIVRRTGCSREFVRR